MRALKLASLVTCSLALSVTTVAAAPQVLDDAALDGVVAGAPGSFSDFFEGRSLGQGLFPLILRPLVPEEGRVIAREEGQTVVDEPGRQVTITTGEDAQLWRLNPEQFLSSAPASAAFLRQFSTWR